MARIDRTRPWPIADFELSRLAMAAAPADPAVGGAAAVALLRRARREGITTFDAVDVPDAAVAETLLARAFPEPDPALVVLVRPREAGTRGRGEIMGRARPSISPEPRPVPPSRTEVGTFVGRRLIEVEAVAEVGSDTGARSRSRGPEDDGTVVRCRSLEEGRAARGNRSGCLLSAEVSLLDRALVALGAPARGEGTVPWIVRNPFAGGRLDGSWFDRGPAVPPPGPPRAVRELEAEFGAVARFGFLVRPRRRTLAQAALQFVLGLPGVAVVCIPMPPVERWEEIVGFAASDPLEEEERARVEGLPELSTPAYGSVRAPR